MAAIASLSGRESEERKKWGKLPKYWLAAQTDKPVTLTTFVVKNNTESNPALHSKK
jgi:hypothetical protein